LNPLLISGFGTSINVDKRKLIVTNKLKQEKLEFFPHRMNHDSIIIDGHTGNITFESMRWLMKNNIHLTLLNWNGNLLSTTISDYSKSGKLRINQYQKYLDGITRYKIARNLVFTKIDCSLYLLSELSKFYPIDIKKIKVSFEKEYQLFESQKLGSISSLITYEGRIAQRYFDGLSVIFAHIAPSFHYEGRKGKSYSWNMNASDEVNALLNYGYAILESEVIKIINSIGLDMAIGYLHETVQFRTSLVYDIMELFRWMTDLSIIQYLDEDKPKKSDFIVTENYNIRLKEKTAKVFIQKIQKNFNHKVPYQKKNNTYQTILQNNVQQLANFISDKRKNIEFVIPRYQINRDDTSILKEKILSISPQERKILGINKSTLFYMKKNLQNGKNIKIYDKVLTKIN
jgi:CRISPR-associated protein Cas1